MSARLYGVVKYSADDQHVAFATTDEEVSRSSDSLSRGAGATMRQVPGKHAVPEFRSSGMPDIAGTRSRVADGCGDQGLIALACILTELLFSGPAPLALREGGKWGRRSPFKLLLAGVTLVAEDGGVCHG